MKKSSTYKLALALGTLAIGLSTALPASAHGWFGGVGGQTPSESADKQIAMFAKQAETLGLTQSEIIAGWAEGKNLKTLAKEKGLNIEQIHEKMRTSKLDRLKSELDILVEKGVITRAQADKRLEFMSSNAKTHRKAGQALKRGI